MIILSSISGFFYFFISFLFNHRLSPLPFILPSAVQQISTPTLSFIVHPPITHAPFFKNKNLEETMINEEVAFRPTSPPTPKKKQNFPRVYQ